MAGEEGDGRLARLAPGLARILRYERSWLRGDLVAGVTVAAYLVPQVMAYAEVAGLPAVAGLWAVVGAMCVYALLGSSRQLSVGPESTTALMTAVAIGPLAGGDPARYAVLAAALALIVAVLCLVGWVARLGFLGELLSKPVLVGYLAGVAVIMIVGQLDTITGIDVEGSTPVEEVVSFLGRLDEAQLPTVVLSAVVLVGLLAGARLFPRAPVPLVAIVLAAVAVAVLDLDVQVIGDVPSGLPRPQLPAVDLADLTALLLPAIGVTVVAYTDNTLTARAFATKGGYPLDPNQELLALGGANLAAGLSQGFPVSSSGSRTVIGDSLGSRSQLYSLVAATAVVGTLLALGGLLATFPSAALGALVVWAALRLVDLAELRRIARFRHSELVLALATTAAVLVVDILYGVLVAVGLSVLDLLRRVARPHDGILGYAPGVAGMHDIDDYPDARQVPGLVVYRYDSPLFFANAEDFKRRALAALDTAEGPVEWFLLNAEANVQVDLTSVDALDELREELESRGVLLALARVKWELREELVNAGFVERLGEDRLFATLPTAVAAFVTEYTARHGHPPPGIVPPEPPEAPIGAR
ncbi:MAG TPA: sulfate permease [Jiangellales bacterium]|nr:sulfate permease [Jiangellales bacterium]